MENEYYVITISRKLGEIADELNDLNNNIVEVVRALRGFEDGWDSAAEEEEKKAIVVDKLMEEVIDMTENPEG